MKSVLISIQPKWCELIASGKKTVEVRKTKPKLETPFKCYIYETNWDKNTYWKTSHKGKLGKVIGEFVCDRIIDIPYSEDFVKYYHTMPQEDFEATSLNMGYIDKYLSSKNGYGWHISDLVIYDKPRELSEFYAKCSYDKGYSNENCKGCSYYETVSVCTGWCITGGYKPITRPPKSWCYVESEEQKMSKEFIGYESAAGGVCRCVRGTSETPSKICLICNCKEFSKSIILRTDVAWLCDRCRNALLKVVESEDAK